MNASNAESQLPRIEEFRSDLTPAQIAAAEAGNTRAIAMRTLLSQVRLPKKPARCAASCTESENAISFLSSL